MTETAKKVDIENHQNNNNLQHKITIDLKFFLLTGLTGVWDLMPLLTLDHQRF